MNGYSNPTLALQFARDRHDRVRREVGRTKLFRESKRLRVPRHTP